MWLALSTSSREMRLKSCGAAEADAKTWRTRKWLAATVPSKTRSHRMSCQTAQLSLGDSHQAAEDQGSRRGWRGSHPIELPESGKSRSWHGLTPAASPGQLGWRYLCHKTTGPVEATQIGKLFLNE